MRTRTLLLLAVACGLVILVAGVVQLLRIAGEDEAVDFSALHTPVQVGDLDVVVESYAESNGTAVVAVRLGGVDDEDAAADFRLVVPDAALTPTGDGDDTCGAVTVAPVACQLAFDIGDAAGGVRVLRIDRGDNSARWELVDPQPS